MKFLIFLSLLFSFSVLSQPMLNDNEFNLEYHLPKHCFKKVLSKCPSSKLNLSIWAGKVNQKLQATLIYKLSGKDGVGKVGGQLWYKLTPEFWIGGETSGALHEIDFDHEIFLAYKFHYGHAFFIPYVGILLQTEHFGSAGAKLYLSENRKINFGGEYRFASKSHPEEAVLYTGFKFSKKDIKDLFEIFNFDFGLEEEEK